MSRTSISARPACLSLLTALMVAALFATPAHGQQYPSLPPESPPMEPSPEFPKFEAPPEGFPLLDEDPYVRIVGVATKRGARITRLTVRAPFGVRIVSKCLAIRKLCPYYKKTVTVKESPQTLPGARTHTVRIKGFERLFRGGVALEVYVVQAERAGKYTRFTIRGAGKRPLRLDRCVEGLVLEPRSCLPE